MNMEENTFYNICIVGLAIILILVVVANGRITLVNNTLSQDKACPELVDLIYSSCLEERELNLTTIKGRNAILYAEYGGCMIRSK